MEKVLGLYIKTSFLHKGISQISPWNTFCSNVLTECIANEKLNVIPIYLQLESVSVVVKHVLVYNCVIYLVV